jgi:hypothetical protein
MKFLENKYCKLYFNIIERAKNFTPSIYTENHHIIPNSLGGTKDDTNMVRLTAREHFICHLLLIKMTEGNAKASMIFAANCMMYTLKNKRRLKITSKTYQSLREQRSAIKFTNEHRAKIAAARTGKPFSAESRLKISLSKTGVKLSDEHKQKIKRSSQGKILSDSHKASLSKKCTGLIKTEEHKKNISNGVKNIPKLICSHCGKTGSFANMKRWHFDNCKLRSTI